MNVYIVADSPKDTEDRLRPFGYEPVWSPYESEAVVVLRGWEDSNRARSDVSLALEHEIPIYRLAGGDPYPDFLIRIFPEFTVTVTEGASTYV